MDDKLEFTMATETDSVMLKNILEKLTLLEASNINDSKT